MNSDHITAMSGLDTKCYDRYPVIFTILLLNLAQTDESVYAANLDGTNQHIHLARQY